MKLLMFEALNEMIELERGKGAGSFLSAHVAAVGEAAVRLAVSHILAFLAFDGPRGNVRPRLGTAERPQFEGAHRSIEGSIETFASNHSTMRLALDYQVDISPQEKSALDAFVTT